MTFSNGSTIAYTYDANGRKLRTVHNVGGTTTTTDYAGNVIYENGVQKKLLTEEGYVDLTSGTYYYYLKDHQGNNRVVVNSGGTVTETNHYYPFGGTFASGTVQPYKYNGKELDTKAGLNWYDYGARHYDAALGRFTTQDPLAEKYYSTSPYGYCLNNPVKFVDPDGKKIVDTNGNVIYTHKTGWSANASEDAIRLGNAMMLTQRGMTQFNSMVDAEHNITLNISSESRIKEKLNENEYILGTAKKKMINKILSVDIIVYEGTLKTYLKDVKTSKSKLYQRAVNNIDEAIGAVGTHESVHATSETNIQQSLENYLKGTNHDVEMIPEKAEYEYLFELLRRKYNENEKNNNILDVSNFEM